MGHVSVSSTTRWKYDVFLSFRGEDTRRKFVDHLYASLVHAHVHTFRDDEELPRGKEISTEPQKAIHESRSSIVVFSKKYASSRWCLDELVEILSCKKAKGQLVLPIFYDIDPSNVRKQSGNVGEALAEHEKHLGNEVAKIVQWRKALTEAANLSGWDICVAENRNKSMFIQKIIEEVVCTLNHTYLDVAIYPVGIDSRVEEVLSLLAIGLEDVRMIGICGMGGIGKTTIAKALYNKIFHLFEGYCFLADVKEVAKSSNGLLVLQKELLSKVLKRKCNKFGNIAKGVNLINKRLQARKVFIIIDDVDQLIQLNTLARSCEWFGSGSRIIITTRDEHLLDEIRVHEKYNVNEMAMDESLQLFSWHAFRETSPIEEYEELSREIVRYTGGLPLALEILGSHLFGRTVLVWESTIKKLQQLPDNKIQEKLKISFDGLDDKAKQAFLDITCFFIGMEAEYVIKILDSRGFYPRIAISVLTSRFLLNVDKGNKLRMHDLVRDMGRNIIHQESPGEPGKRSRLWFHEDVYTTLVKHEGTKAIEGVSLVPVEFKDEQFSTKAFCKMDNLQILQINHVHLHGSYGLLSKELRWLCWQHCPLTCFPLNFQLENLVVLDMQYSNCKEVWKGKKVLANMMVLDLSHSQSLTKTPNLSGAPLLEKLLLKGCNSLRKIHHSIGLLNRLVHLNLKDCKKLRRLPNSICRLKALEYLNLTGCVELKQLPEDIGYMKGLKELFAGETAIQRLPYSIGFLKNLKFVALQGCNRKRLTKSLLPIFSSCTMRDFNITRFLPPSISGLHSIRRLALSNCNLSDGDLPAEIGNLSSLDHLDLTKNNFYSLPSTLYQLSKLNWLYLNDCRSLSSVPKLPPNLSYLFIYNCTSLGKLHLPSISKLQFIFFDFCNGLCESHGVTCFDYQTDIAVNDFTNLPTIFKDNFFKGLLPFSIDYMIAEIPRRFSYQITGLSMCFDMPIDMKNKFQGMLLCVVYGGEEIVDMTDAPTATICDKTNGVEGSQSFLYGGFLRTAKGHIWVSYVPKGSLDLPFNGGETMEVFVKTNTKLEVTKFGVHLLYKIHFEGIKEDEEVRHQSLEDID